MKNQTPKQIKKEYLNKLSNLIYRYTISDEYKRETLVSSIQIITCLYYLWDDICKRKTYGSR